MTVRVRYAPSPTGYQHFGNLRTAVFNYMFARKQGGTFILRIEDTDLERSKKEYEEQIRADFEWLGLDIDESPWHGGEYGPYRQSERIDIYREHLEKLIKDGMAFKCFCDADEEKVEAGKGSKKGKLSEPDPCRFLSAEDAARYEKEEKPYCWRFATPRDKVVRFKDLVRGDVRVKGSEVTDFVLLKKDGMPTYHFSVVVDDALMKITHIIRGRDHLTNTANHWLLYEALGFEKPTWCHISRTSKLKKREMLDALDNLEPGVRPKAPIPIMGYRKLGYLPEAVVNYSCLLGWHPRDEQEKFVFINKIREFNTKDLTKGDSAFDMAKFNWLAERYILEEEPAWLAKLARPFFEKAGVPVPEDAVFEKLLDALRGKCAMLSELPPRFLPFVSDVEPDEQANEALSDPKGKEVILAVAGKLEAASDFAPADFDNLIREVGEELELKGKALFWPLRSALIGTPHGREMPLYIEVFGKEGVVKRLRAAVGD
ncbi:MAG: glutamate--tRNA ligase [Planctomycetota bacterium]|jgi:glutamyl-tRNA synthetase